MSDVGLVYRFEEVAGSGRNRLLVLLEGLTSLPVEQLRHLTLSTAADVLKALPDGTPHRNRIEAVFRSYVTRMKERDPSMNKDSLLFPAHGERTKGFAPSVEPLSRVQVWRVVKAAVQAVLGASVRGAITALRNFLLRAEEEEVNNPPAVSSISNEPPDKTTSKRYVHLTPEEEEAFFLGIPTT